MTRSQVDAYFLPVNMYLIYPSDSLLEGPEARHGNVEIRSGDRIGSGNNRFSKSYVHTGVIGPFPCVSIHPHVRFPNNLVPLLSCV